MVCLFVCVFIVCFVSRFVSEIHYGLPGGAPPFVQLTTCDRESPAFAHFQAPQKTKAEAVLGFLFATNGTDNIKVPNPLVEKA